VPRPQTRSRARTARKCCRGPRTFYKLLVGKRPQDAGDGSERRHDDCPTSSNGRAHLSSDRGLHPVVAVRDRKIADRILLSVRWRPGRAEVARVHALHAFLALAAPVAGSGPEQGSTMEAENPNQAQPSGDRPTVPPSKSPPPTPKPRPGSASTPGKGLPDYGDQEPGDPRHVEIEGQPPHPRDGGPRSERSGQSKR